MDFHDEHMLHHLLTDDRSPLSSDMSILDKQFAGSPDPQGCSATEL